MKAIKLLSLMALTLVNMHVQAAPKQSPFNHTVLIRYLDSNLKECVAIKDFSHCSPDDLSTFIKETVLYDTEYLIALGYDTAGGTLFKEYKERKAAQLIAYIIHASQSHLEPPIIVVQATRADLVRPILNDYVRFAKRSSTPKNRYLRYFEGNGSFHTYTITNYDIDVSLKNVRVYKPHPLFDPHDWRARLLMKVNLR